jgi:hypothetical protein
MSSKGKEKREWRPGDRGRPPAAAKEALAARARAGQQTLAPGGQLVHPATAVPSAAPPAPAGAGGAGAPAAASGGAHALRDDEDSLLDEYGVCEHGVLLSGGSCPACAQAARPAAAERDEEVGEETARGTAASWRVPRHQVRGSALRARWQDLTLRRDAPAAPAGEFHHCAPGRHQNPTVLQAGAKDEPLRRRLA